MLYSSFNIGSAIYTIVFSPILPMFNFKIMAMIKEKDAKRINGNENPPIVYNSDPITGPHKNPKEEKNSVIAIF